MNTWEILLNISMIFNFTMIIMLFMVSRTHRILICSLHDASIRQKFMINFLIKRVCNEKHKN